MAAANRSIAARIAATALASAAVVVVLATAALAAPSHHRASKHHRPPAKLIISRAPGAAIRVPDSFFGLSTEYWSLPSFMVQQRPFERALTLMQVPHDGPLVLRIGGDSADLTYWNPGTFQLPPNAYVLTDAWFRSTASLVSDLRLRVVFDLNLHRSTPDLSAGLASAALSYMPMGSVVGFEIGNEPDRYHNGYAIANYVQDFQSYTAAISGVAPTLPRMGPASGDAEGGYQWLRGLITGDRALVGMATSHRYGLDPCLPRGFARYPSVNKVLSDRYAAAQARPVASAVRFVHAAGLRFRLDEFNSVTCGGLPGVSDTFATALWAPDALFRMLRTGLDGIHLHMRPDRINAPFIVTQSGLQVRPLMYGLILFARTLDGRGRLVPLRIRGNRKRAGVLDAWAVRVRRHQLRVLLINKTAKPVHAILRFSAKGNAALETLRGRGASATSGVTLSGQQLGPRGGWVGKKVVHKLPLTAPGYALVVPRFSAALVSFQLR